MFSSTRARQASPLGPPRWMLCRAVEDDFPLVRAVNVGDLRAKLALESIHARARLVQLVLQAEHMLDTGVVEPELGRQPVDQAEALDVRVRVETRTARSAPGAHEPLRLVH